MLVIAILFLLLVVVFALQNAEMVPITFMVWSFSLNQALVVLGSASLGVIIGAVWAWFRNIGNRTKVKELTKELNALRDKNAVMERTMADILKEKERYEVGEPER